MYFEQPSASHPSKFLLQSLYPSFTRSGLVSRSSQTPEVPAWGPGPEGVVQHDLRGTWRQDRRRSGKTRKGSLGGGTIYFGETCTHPGLLQSARAAAERQKRLVGGRATGYRKGCNQGDPQLGCSPKFAPELPRSEAAGVPPRKMWRLNSRQRGVQWMAGTGGATSRTHTDF